MPNRNVQKIYLEDCYYHVYNRGVNKNLIFEDEEDYSVFLNLFKRYLDKNPAKDSRGREYKWMREDIQLVAYCLMPNHYHLLLYQINPHAVTELLRAINSAYVTYFNRKHARVGHLFQERFRASIVDKDDYLMHITRYIHRNPNDYKKWPFSSLDNYLGRKEAAWLDPSSILGLFESIGEYEDFVENYDSQEIDHEIFELV